MFHSIRVLTERGVTDSCFSVVRRWLHRKLLLFLNMLGLDCCLLVVSGSGRVCVYEDYLPSSPPGLGSCRKRQIKTRWGIFTLCYQRSEPLRDSIWARTERRGGVTAFTVRKYKIWLIHQLLSPLTRLSWPFSISVSLCILSSLTAWHIFLFISISKSF